MEQYRIFTRNPSVEPVQGNRRFLKGKDGRSDKYALDKCDSNTRYRG
jgi:hypothetical protein